VKFDFRYVILVKNIEDLEVYIYKNFFLRFANKPFVLDDFDSYQTHFTVMNYGENLVLKHVKCAEFLGEFKEQYPKQDWSELEDKVCEMLKELFVAATKEKPPKGIGISPQSRSLYAIDAMLSWKDGKMQPKLLEVNFMPDCKRACEYYPDFYNDIFKLLFLEQDNPDVFRRV
jgi:tubulin--tyrosine ligase-like protein 12